MYHAAVAAILLVDADGEQQVRLRTGLEANGHAVIPAQSASAGVALLREGGIDLVIVHHTDRDQTSALMTGLEKLPDPPPFVMVSGQVDAPQLSARIGAAAFVPKPCAIGDLLPVVDRVMSMRAVPGEFEEIPTRPNEKTHGGADSD